MCLNTSNISEKHDHWNEISQVFCAADGMHEIICSFFVTICYVTQNVQDIAVRICSMHSKIQKISVQDSYWSVTCTRSPEYFNAELLNAQKLQNISVQSSYWSVTCTKSPGFLLYRFATSMSWCCAVAGESLWAFQHDTAEKWNSENQRLVWD